MLRSIILLPLLILIQHSFAQTPNVRIVDKQFELHAYQAALDNYLLLLKADPNSARLHTRAGLCYYHTGRPAEAAGHLEKARSFRDFDPAQLQWLGRALMMTGDYRRAAEVFRDFAEFDPQTGNHFLAMARNARSLGEEPSRVRVSPERISSRATDFGLGFQADRVIFSSFNPNVDNPPSGWVSGDQYHYLFMAKPDATGALGAPRLLKKELRIVYNDGPAAYRPDGREVVFMRTRFSGNNRLVPEAGFQSSLFIADVNANGLWENIRPFPYNGTGWSCAWPAYSEDGRTLYFASDRPEGFGGYDIWSCQRSEDDWSAPANLGAVVNTPGHEITPFPLGENLRFASDWHPGLGGFDLFRAIRTQDKFVAVFHEGPGLNAPADDLGLIVRVDGRSGYFTSNRHGRGDLDIYRFETDYQEAFLRILHAISNQPVSGAVLEPGACLGSAVRSDANGLLRLPLGAKEDCTLRVTHPDFADQIVDTRLLRMKQGVHTVNLKPSEWIIPATVRDKHTGRPIANVRLRLTDQRSGYYQDFESDAEGNLRVSMAPETQFFALLSGQGYQEMSQTIQTGARPDIDLLGTFHMESLGGAPTATAEPSGDISAADRRQPVSALPPGTPVFAIQVAAVRPGNESDVSAWESLARFGTVYQKGGDQIVRIRVGLFEDRTEAEQIARDIEAAGHPGAFVVTEQAETLLDQVMISMARSRPDAAKPETAKPEAAKPEAAKETYLIRLAAYRNPKWFDPAGLERFGAIRDEQNGEWTIKLVGGIASLADARQALKAAREAGFQEAYILREAEGQRTRVE